MRGLAAQTQQKIDPSVPPPHLPGLRIPYFMARTRAGSKYGARLVSGVYQKESDLHICFEVISLRKIVS